MKKYYGIMRKNKKTIVLTTKDSDLLETDKFLFVEDSLPKVIGDFINLSKGIKCLSYVNMLTSEQVVDKINIKNPSSKFLNDCKQASLYITGGTGVSKNKPKKKYVKHSTKKNKENEVPNVKKPLQMSKDTSHKITNDKKVSKGSLFSYTDKEKQLMRDTHTDSLGEYKIYKYLESLDIKFNNQYLCELVCINPKSGLQMPYDFEIPSIKLVIEVQGVQHYKRTKKFNKTSAKLKNQKYKDAYKKRFAKSRGYTELEISYKEIKYDYIWKKKLQPYIDKYKEKQN